MAFGFKESEASTTEVQSQEIQTTDLNELPDDSGEQMYRAELPDDSGEVPNQENMVIDIEDQRDTTDSLAPIGKTENDVATDDNSSDFKNTAESSDDSENKLPERMDQVVIKFKFPPGANEAQKKEFIRQLKAQERGINSQSVAENTENRDNYQKRKKESGKNGRANEAAEAQQQVREKAVAQRIASNQEKGMSYAEAKAEAQAWIKTQAALHDPDQIAGGDPVKVSRMGDKGINSSIGAQWKSRVSDLSKAVEDFSKNYTAEELKQIKMNVKLEVE